MPEIPKNPSEQTTESKEMTLTSLTKMAVKITDAAQDISRLTTSEIEKQLEFKSKNGIEYAFKALGSNVINIYKKDPSGQYSNTNYLQIAVNKAENGALTVKLSLIENGVRETAGTVSCTGVTCTSEDGLLVQVKVTELIDSVLVAGIRKQEELLRIAEEARLAKEAEEKIKQDEIDKKAAENEELTNKVNRF